MKNPIYRSVVELRAALGAGEITATRIVDAHLEQIFVHNRAINALVTVDETGARESARESDEARARGEDPGPLHGIPFTVKDMFETKGLRTTNGHKPLANNIPERDATVVARLREAGGTLLAKSNMPAQGMDIQCENALFGATKNPWDLSRTPGGSTGGEAAALAAGMTPLGIGSDIGGSLRIPAHYCGVFACKPTEGLVPRTGLLLPGTVNTVRHMVACGPMARSVADLRLALRIMAGPDGVDPSVVPVPLKEFPLRPLKDHRFAWTDDFGGLPVTASTREAMEKLASDLRDAG
ncbi:amidase, partial [Myxococcota bacterium]|nr:amidase [Myxococcota bacterium]MBU1536671.1 amidase [Myxococcota bacterium]